jgi:hypothetical protein
LPTAAHPVILLGPLIVTRPSSHPMYKAVLHFLENFGNVVGRVLMTLIYFVAVAPVAILYKLFTDTLLLKPPASTYQPWSAVNETLDDARRQD